jgi:hypothetical protein
MGKQLGGAMDIVKVWKWAIRRNGATHSITPVQDSQNGSHDATAVKEIAELPDVYLLSRVARWRYDVV